MHMNDNQKDNYGKRRNYAIFLGSIVISGILVLFVFYRLYNTSRQSIINMWDNRNSKMAADVEYYLATPKDAVFFTAKRVEDMMKIGASNKEINDYLVGETQIYATVIDSNNTGIYGYCNGEYLDGSGWIPSEDYVPTKRPWYVAAKKANGEIAYAKPYMNLQSKMLTMSVCKLLNDEKSVISMDIYLDGLQKFAENLQLSEGVGTAFVIDRSGFVVAHSNVGEIGKDYLMEGRTDQIAVLRKVFSKEDTVFETKIDSKRYFVFSKQITNEWFAVFLINRYRMFEPIKYIYIILLFMFAFAFMLNYAVLYIYSLKQKETGRLESELRAIADIYTSMNIFDLKEKKFKRLRVSSNLDEALGNNYEFDINRSAEIANLIGAEASKSILMHFMDLRTLEERLGNLNSISQEFLDYKNQWFRMRFIVVDRDTDGHINRVLWTTESIDEDRKHQEHLRILAETDSLTGVLNRNGGETRIFERLSKGKYGMLLLLDADHFKFVNDNYGHDMGDKVIIAIANCLKETFRESDIVFRLGGDEFAAFASGVDSEDIGRIVIYRLFTNIDKIYFPKMTEWKLKISVGAVFCRSDSKDGFADFYQNADKAMYESKQYDGNYVTFFRE